MCSGVHRSLGVQHSKVRSLTLDAWEPEIIKVMMELGNQVVNNIYEARVDDAVQRATEKCDSGVREAWIKAKYIERRFVLPIGEPMTIVSDEHTTSDDGTDTTDQEKSARKPAVRRWSVRKQRRRPKSKPTAAAAAAAAQASPLLSSVQRLSVMDEDSMSSASNQSGESLLVLGKDIGGDPLPKEDFALSSDQESTGGEDNALDDPDDIACLNPNLLLYKASTVHNLPVMCQAMALGASKSWTNPDDLNRTALHQAVLSVCVYRMFWGKKRQISVYMDNFHIFSGFGDGL